MKPTPFRLKNLLLAVFCLGFGSAFGHSIPETAVRGSFHADGAAEISIEVNPRIWEANPSEAPSTEFAAFLKMGEAEKAELVRKTKEAIAKSVEFTFEPLGRIQPDFEFTFGAEGGKLLKTPTDAVVLVGRWRTQVPAGITGWKIRSLPGHKVSVLLNNKVNDQDHPRFCVLFPGETSFTLDLTTLHATAPTQAAAGSVSAHDDDHGGWSTFVSFLDHGYQHVLPLGEMRTDWRRIADGLDHILFVLGIFLLSRSWKPIVTQVTAFTLAHSLTLGLAAAGWIKVPAAVVEPIIALSIAAVALENIFRPDNSRWRLVIVAVFGAFHGLGFASGLSEHGIPQQGFFIALTGFNLGVEGAQLTIIAVAFALTLWIRDEERYRRWLVIPASAAIAVTGLYWAVTRLIAG
jgi:hydrogenase/urease accessory protein HupE